MRDKLDECFLVRFSKKTGKIDTTLSAHGCAMLKLFALNNTPASKECLVFDGVEGEVLFHTIGKKNDFPTVEEHDLGHIDDWCVGLLESVWMNKI